LDENLWYTSGIESFISTMETSALMGRNVAKLVVDEWLTRDDTEKEGIFRAGGLTGYRDESQLPLELKEKL